MKVTKDMLLFADIRMQCRQIIPNSLSGSFID